jgi:hypothetical protein
MRAIITTLAYYLDILQAENMYKFHLTLFNYLL